MSADAGGGRRAGRRPRSARAQLLLAAALLALTAAAAAAGAAPGRVPEELLAPARARLKEAADAGAARRVPSAYREAAAAIDSLRARLDADPEGARAGRYAAELAAAERSAARAAALARFVNDLRLARNDHEAVALRYDRDLSDLARAAGVSLSPGVAGTEAAQALIDSLGRRRLQQQYQLDSLRVALRSERQRCRDDLAVKEAVADELRQRVSRLEQQLWGTELRAGKLEADATHAEARLRAKQHRQETVKRLGEQFGKLGCEVLMSPAGDVIMRLSALNFPVGQAALAADSQRLLDTAIAALGEFPGARLRVEGHTDDTGGRQANLRLSRERAETIAALLRARLALPAEMVEVVGHGPDRPLASNATPQGRAQNRRIDVVVLTGDEGKP